MTMHFGETALRAAADGAIGADEILALRRAGWADGQMTPEEAEALFIANDQLDQPSREWCDFFVEALGEFIINTVEPRGYVDQAMADELIAQIDRDGRVGTLAELELLVRVLERATSVPAVLKVYALSQIEQAVLGGEGPTRHGELDPAGITASECALLRRMIFAPASDAPAGVSQAEAEMLFRIKDATLYDANAPEWESLFVQGVASFLIGFAGTEPLPAQRAAELERFMASEGAGIGNFLARMLGAEVENEVAGAFGSLLDLGAAASEPDSDEAPALDAEEERWLVDHIEADEELDPLEKALLAFIAQETGEAGELLRAA